MQIYLGRGGKQAGPYTQDELNQMLRDEQVELTDLFWSQGMPEWRPLSEVTGGSHYWDGINRTLAPSMPSESGALLEDRPVEVKDLSPFDNSKAKRDLGWTPVKSKEEFVRRAISEANLFGF